MYAYHFIIVLSGLLVDLSQGQLQMKLVGDEAYIFPNLSKNHTQAAQQCTKYGATLIRNFSSSAKDPIIQSVGKVNIWLVNKQSPVTGECTSMELNTQTTITRKCSTELPVVCTVQAWKSNIVNKEIRFGFSNAKLRYADAKNFCKMKGQQYGLHGDLVTITSQKMQDFLAQHTSSSDGSAYFINSNNKDKVATNNYRNWETEKIPPGGSQCIQMNQRTSKWIVTSCENYRRFICEWKLGDRLPTTTASDPGTTPSSVTTGMLNHKVKMTVVPTSKISQSKPTTSGSTRIHTFEKKILTVVAAIATFMVPFFI